VLVFQTDPDAAGKAGGTRTSGSASSAQRRSSSRLRQSRGPAGRFSSAGSSAPGSHSSSSPTRTDRGGSGTSRRRRSTRADPRPDPTCRRANRRHRKSPVTRAFSVAGL
jgi:hypothetical protein